MDKFKMKDYGFVTDIKVSNTTNGKTIFVSGYRAWCNMAQRCYRKDNENYKDYGGKGIYVKDEFKTFSVFKAWYDDKNPTGELHMDKDILNKRYYGFDSITFVSKEDNNREMVSRRSNVYLKEKVGEKNPMYGMTGEKSHSSKTKEYFSNNPTQRCHFKRTCKRQGWNFEDFEEVFAEWYVKPNGSRERKFIYIFKKI